MSHCARALRAVLLGLCAAAAAWQPARAGSARPAAPATGVPGLRNAEATAGAMPAPLLRVLQGSGLPLTSFGVYVQRVNALQPLAALNAEAPYLMASTAKIVTSLAGLELLGTSYRWRTQAYLTGPIVNGELRGNLVIAGGGNPQLTTAELRTWLKQMRQRGLDRVDGDILVDRSAFALGDDDFKSTPAPLQPRHVWPDALMVDEGLMQVLVQPGRAGKAAVLTEPPLAGVKLVNQVEMRGGCGAWAQWTAAGGSPAGAGRHVGATSVADASPQLVVHGDWSSRCGSRPITVLAPTHANVAMHAVAGLWAEVGGKLTGNVRGIDLAAQHPEHLRMPRPGFDGEPVLPWSTHLSQPLPQLLVEMNKSSNNLTARHLMLSLARGFPLKPASISAAQTRLKAWFQRQGLREGDIALDNGSGLSRDERGKPRALVQLLLNAWFSPLSKPFVESLPVAGVDGTLAHRMLQGAATGRAFLKTGTLHDTRALAGYVQGASGQVYAIAALVNHEQAARATPSLDAMIEWLAKNG